MNPVAAIQLAIGLGFFAVNARGIVDYVQFMRRRAHALLVWPGPRPRNETLGYVLAVALGLIVIAKVLYQPRPQIYSETMMMVYFALLVPLRQRIGRGFYEDGIWADNAFIPYNEVGGISWRESEHHATLIVISRLRNLARRLMVPGDKYGAARRLLRDKIGEHEIHFAGTGLDLGERDERDEA